MKGPVDQSAAGVNFIKEREKTGDFRTGRGCEYQAFAQ